MRKLIVALLLVACSACAVSAVAAETLPVSMPGGEASSASAGTSRPVEPAGHGGVSLGVVTGSLAQIPGTWPGAIVASLAAAVTGIAVMGAGLRLCRRALGR